MQPGEYRAVFVGGGSGEDGVVDRLAGTSRGICGWKPV